MARPKYHSRFQELFDEGKMTFAQVSKFLDCNIETVRKWEKKTGQRFKRDNPNWKQRWKRRPKNYRRLEYVLSAILQRCYNPKNPSFRFYGAKGCTVADYWNPKIVGSNAFLDFYNFALQTEWAPGLTFDRRDNNLGYSKENFRRWATNREQQENRRKAKLSAFIGVSKKPGRRSRPWHAQIRFNGKIVSIGYFASEKDAALAYDQFVRDKKSDHPLNFVIEEKGVQ